MDWHAVIKGMGDAKTMKGFTVVDFSANKLIGGNVNMAVSDPPDGRCTILID